MTTYPIKTNQYNIRGVTNQRFSSHLQNRLQYVNMNSSDSNFGHICSDVLQVSTQEPLFFLIHTNSLYCAFRYSSVYHFAIDTKLLNYNNSVKKTNIEVD